MHRPSHTKTAYVVDDQKSMSDSLSQLMTSFDIKAECFNNPVVFLQQMKEKPPASTSCLILDLIMPEMSGLKVMAALDELSLRIPTIMVSAHGDVASAVQAMRLGALDFLAKPFSVQALVERVHEALRISEKQLERQSRSRVILQRAQKLTPREKQILRSITTGRDTKEIAAEMSISPNTVDSHRAHIFQKLEAQSLAQLIVLGLEVIDDL